jgi:hypothetical protein
MTQKLYQFICGVKFIMAESHNMYKYNEFQTWDIQTTQGLRIILILVMCVIM